MNGLNLTDEERGLKTKSKALRYKESVPFLGKRYVHFIRLGKRMETFDSGKPELLVENVRLRQLQNLYKDADLDWDEVELVDIELIVDSDKNNFRIDLHDFSELSREVGYYNYLSNIKDEEDNYDKESIEKYEKLRLKQLEMFEKMILLYS